LFADIFYHKRFQNMFDLITFDGGTVYWMNLNKERLLNIFKYTYDNSSLVVMDNEFNQTQACDKKGMYNASDKVSVPKYCTINRDYTTQNDNIKGRAYNYKIKQMIYNIALWFDNNFDKENMIIKGQKYFFNDTNECMIEFKQNMVDCDKTKLNIFFNSKNIYSSLDNVKIFLYFIGTKVMSE